MPGKSIKKGDSYADKIHTKKQKQDEADEDQDKWEKQTADNPVNEEVETGQPVVNE